MGHDSELDRLGARLDDLQSRLVRSRRMAMLGALTAGLAHELNNPIGFMKNNALMLDEYLQILLPLLRDVLIGMNDPAVSSSMRRERILQLSGGEQLNLPLILEDIQPLLADVRDGVQRMEDILGALRNIAREDQPEGEYFDINQCVRDSLKLAWNELKYKATLVQTLTEVSPLHGKPGEINQVILNLLINAARAQTGFGEVRVSTHEGNGEVWLCIADNGTALTKDHLERRFKPLETTDASDVDAGWDLSISRDILAAHGGRLEISSVPEAGSEFRAFLPVPAEMIHAKDI